VNGKLYDTNAEDIHGIFVTSQYFQTIQKMINLLCLSQRDLNSGNPQFEAEVLSTRRY